MPPAPFDRVAFAGVGLIGGSLALAMRARGLAREAVGIGRGRDNLELGVRRGAIDRYEIDPREGVRGADLVVMGTPVSAMAGVLAAAREGLADRAIVTDVGSVKKGIVEAIEPIVEGRARFVGGHPIAGTERSGVAHARADLFEGGRCVLTPTERTDPDALERVKGMWEAVGMEVVLMEAGRHDSVLATVSHLPHMVAFGLLDAVAGMESETGDLVRYSGGGFRDFTRIGQSDPSMWRDICLMNREAILEGMDCFATAFARLRALVEASDGEGLGSAFARARAVRAAVGKASRGPLGRG